MRFGICSDCGKRVRGRYARCYNCNRRRRRGHWYDPEHLPGQAERDAELGRREFYVYLLETDYGHYVGHTANVQARLGSHTAGEVPSTAGGLPRLLWVSRPLPARADAAQFEAALKSLRDRQSERFQAITGYEPRPFQPVPAAPKRPIRAGCGLPGVAAAVAGIVVVSLLLYYGIRLAG